MRVDPAIDMQVFDQCPLWLRELIREAPLYLSATELSDAVARGFNEKALRAAIARRCAELRKTEGWA